MHLMSLRGDGLYNQKQKQVNQFSLSSELLLSATLGESVRVIARLSQSEQRQRTIFPALFLTQNPVSARL